jgi:ribosomal-protein-alanine N-acetyltransferase
MSASACESNVTRCILQTQRLVLEPIEESDASFYLTLMNSPKWLQFIGDRKVYSVEDAKSYIRDRMLPQWDRLGYGNYIVRKNESSEFSSVPIGAVGIFSRPGLDTVDLGFAFLEEFERQGYAYESARCLLDEAFAKFNLNVIQAITDPENFSCQRLLAKLGFLLIDRVVLPNETKEVLRYQCVKSNAMT